MAEASLNGLDPSLYRKKVSRDELEHLRHENQVVKASKLERLLSLHGFRFVNQAGGHASYKNDTFPDIRCTFIPHHGSNDPNEPNWAVAEACLAVRNQWRAREAAETARIQAFNAQVQSAQAAAKNGKDRRINPIETMPDDIIGTKHNGEIIFMHRTYQCIGVAVPDRILPEQKEAYIKNIYTRVATLKDNLIRAEAVFEVDVFRPSDGSLVLTMPAYDMTLTLPSFIDGSRSERPLQKIDEFLFEIEYIDDHRFTITSNFIQSNREDDILTGQTDFREGEVDPLTGKKTWAVKHGSYVSSGYKWIEFHTTPKGRPWGDTIYAYNDAVFSHTLSPQDSGGRLMPKSFMKKQHGLEVKPAAQNGWLTITHPFYPDIAVTVPDPEKIVKQTKLARQFREGKLSEEALNKAREESEAQREVLHERIPTLLNDLAHRNNEAAPRSLGLLKMLHESRFFQQMAHAPLRPQTGEPFRIRYRHIPSGATVSQETIQTNQRGESGALVFLYNSASTENALKQLQDMGMSVTVQAKTTMPDGRKTLEVELNP